MSGRYSCSMKNEKEYTLLCKKLRYLKSVIVDLDSHSMELIYLSAKVEMKLRKNDLTKEEMVEYEEKIDKLVKDVQKENNIIIK